MYSIDDERMNDSELELFDLYIDVLSCCYVRPLGCDHLLIQTNGKNKNERTLAPLRQLQM